MITIEENQEGVVLIATFSVDPDDQQELVDLVNKAAEETMQDQSGFISTTLLKSLDGEHVAHYSQWESRGAVEALPENPEVGARMEKHDELGEVEGTFYEAMSTHNAYSEKDSPITIEENQEGVELIATFSVDPNNQQELFDLVNKAAEETMQDQSGFISTAIHKSLDGGHVAHYSQWESPEVVEALPENPEVAAHREKVNELAEPGGNLFEVVSTYEADSEDS